MNTATKTTTSRKAMRVATVFTGAAAAAVAFAPGAMAVPDHAAQANGKAHALEPAITPRGCTTNTWLHIKYEGAFRTLCRQFGFAGISHFSATMEGECGGNNIGRIWESGAFSPIKYRQGSTYRAFNRVAISKVSISRWSGSETCAWP